MGGCRPTAGGHHLYVFFWPDISGAGCPIPWEFKNMFFVFLDFNAANRGNSQTVALSPVRLHQQGWVPLMAPVLLPVSPRPCRCCEFSL